MDLSFLLADMLSSGQAFTIQRLEDGFMVSLADDAKFDNHFVYVPRQIKLSERSLDEAVEEFHREHIMHRHEGFEA